MTVTVPCRNTEVKLLTDLMATNEPNFLALYGRRRIGKTFLIREFFSKPRGIFLEVTGLKNGKTAQQLTIFNQAFIKAFAIDFKIETPQSWVDAFEQLTIAIEKTPKNRWVVLFFDELPWLATKRSGLIQAIDHYWNTRWSKRKKLLFIGCGSAAYWMINNLIHARGGLHNRVTATLNLKPFTLCQTKEYLMMRGLRLSNQQLLQIYMTIGGVPHYLQRIKKGISFVHTIDALCFKKSGLLFDEFDNLFGSLFDNYEAHIALIKEIAKHTYGISRDNLIKQLKKVSSGGRLTKRLDELDKAGFITLYALYGYVERETFCRVIDEYVLFYLTWIKRFKQQFKIIPESGHYWAQQYKTQRYNVWCGYAFELICLKHIDKIIAALKIEHLIEGIGPWRFIAKDKKEYGVQIDLLLNRTDGFINICEIKYNTTPFSIDKAYAENLKRKITVVESKLKKQAQITFITVTGLKENTYSKALVANTITVDDLLC